MAKSLGIQIKRLRTAKGLSLNALAKRLKIDRAHLSRIETGKVDPSSAMLHKLSKCLGGDQEELSTLCGRLPKDVQAIINDSPRLSVSYLRRLSAISQSDLLCDASSNGNGAGPRKFKVIDLFSGAGGFTRGLIDTGRFEPVFANDFNKWAVETYNSNFGNHCVGGDINEFLDSSSSELPKADVVIGGPPCQGFSLLNKKRVGDPRKQLWRAYMEVVQKVRPLAFVMENVPELLASEEYQEVLRMAHGMGYQTEAAVLNAADYGLPQRRRRAIIMATRFVKPKLPAATHFNPKKGADPFNNGLLPWESVRRAIGDLPVPVGIEARVGIVEPPMDLHFGRSPLASSVQRYKCVPEGGNRLDLQKKRPDLTPQCWLRKGSGGTDLFGRLWWDRPAFTIRTEFFKPEKGRYLHPSQHRPITHREAARLQSFPDDFIFQGTKIEIARQIGNAVPPLLAHRIGEALAATLDSLLEPAEAALSAV
jgi:DNA (cytosine-5)-methyltransferase 1